MTHGQCSYNTHTHSIHNVYLLYNTRHLHNTCITWKYSTYKSLLYVNKPTLQYFQDTKRQYDKVCHACMHAINYLQQNACACRWLTSREQCVCETRWFWGWSPIRYAGEDMYCNNRYIPVYISCYRYWKTRRIVCDSWNYLLHRHFMKTINNKFSQGGVYVCMYVRIHGCMYVCIIYVCACMYACMHIRMHACMYARMHACMYAWVYTHIHKQITYMYDHPNHI